MTQPDVRWRQRFDNFGRALRQLTDAVALLRSRPLSELERQGLIQAIEWFRAQDALGPDRRMPQGQAMAESSARS